MTWRETARDSRSAAYELAQNRRWRSCVSRAYYAVYAEATYALLRAGVQMPSSRGNPGHRELPNLVGYRLTSLPLQKRWALSGIISKLRGFRVISDYNPSLNLDETVAKSAMRFMAQAFKILEVIQ